MRIVVAAVGRLKHGPERELAERYRERAGNGRPQRRLANRNHRNPGEPRRRRRPAHARGVDRPRQHHPRGRRHGDPRRARREPRAARPSRQLQGWRAQDRPAVGLHHRRTRGLAPSLRDKAGLPSPSAPRPGRTSSSASCCWNRFTARSPSWPATPITAREKVPYFAADNRRRTLALVLIRYQSGYLLRPWTRFCIERTDAGRAFLSPRSPPAERGGPGNAGSAAARADVCRRRRARAAKSRPRPIVPPIPASHEALKQREQELEGAARRAAQDDRERARLRREIDAIGDDRRKFNQQLIEPPPASSAWKSGSPDAGAAGAARRQRAGDAGVAGAAARRDCRGARGLAAIGRRPPPALMSGPRTRCNRCARR